MTSHERQPVKEVSDCRNAYGVKALQESMIKDDSMMLYTWEESQSSSISESRCFLSFDSDPSARNIHDCDNVKRALFDDWTDEHGTEVKASRKEQYSRGISAAASFIVEYISKYKCFGLNEIDTVTSIIVLGQKVDFTSTIGKNFLKKMNSLDRDFVKIAFMSAAKIRESGGVKMDMEAAVVSVLACRGIRYIRRSMFTKENLEEISDMTAMSVMNGSSIQKVRKSCSHSQIEEKSQTSSKDPLPLSTYRNFDQCSMILENILNYLCFTWHSMEA